MADSIDDLRKSHNLGMTTFDYDRRGDKPSNPELTSFIREVNMALGLNTAHDYEGVNHDADCALYMNSIIEKIRKLKR